MFDVRLVEFGPSEMIEFEFRIKERKADGDAFRLRSVILYLLLLNP